MDATRTATLRRDSFLLGMSSCVDLSGELIRRSSRASTELLLEIHDGDPEQLKEELRATSRIRQASIHRGQTFGFILAIGLLFFGTALVIAGVIPELLGAFVAGAGLLANLVAAMLVINKQRSAFYR